MRLVIIKLFDSRASSSAEDLNTLVRLATLLLGVLPLSRCARSCYFA